MEPTYRDEIVRAMTMLGALPGTLFVGQAVAFPGTAMTSTLEGVPHDKLLEMPVTEEMQMGICTGLSLQGYLPICIYPRMNFMLRAADQIVNHLDKLAEMSGGRFKPRVIIRVAVPTPETLHPGPQHLGDYYGAFYAMCRTIQVRRIVDTDKVMEVYREALAEERSSMIIEYHEFF